MEFSSFTDPRSYFVDPFPSNNVGIFKCSVFSHGRSGLVFVLDLRPKCHNTFTEEQLPKICNEKHSVRYKFIA